MFLTTTHRAAVTVRALDLSVGPGRLIEALAAQDDPVVLDSAALHPTWGRYTVLACCPIEVLTLREDRLTDSRGEVLADNDNSLWKALAAAFGCVKVTDRPSDVEYLPGWFGYVGYEVGRRVERLPGRARRDLPLPDLRLAFYDAILVYDALRRVWSLVNLQFADPPAGSLKAARTLEELALAHAGSTNDPDEQGHPQPVESADAAEMAKPPSAVNFTPDQYRSVVRRAARYIAAGDIFQVNLSQRFTVDPAPPPMAIYQVLRRRNPAWYAAYMSFEAAQSPSGRCAILSSSPELFLRVRGDRVITRPIKGTRRRRGDDVADEKARRDLWDSPKDNAELAMIIDLLRNDLGRVCRFGSVRVAEARAMETHPTVFHLVGTVEGRLREGVGPAELLRATFPGGSITGAPKIRAMEIIDELEPVARGVYTGCIGTAGVDGSCEWNIAIRTIVHDGSRAHVQVGGGIVADSDDQAEYVETLDKARALLEAIAETAS